MWSALFSAIAALPGILGYLEKFATWLSSQVFDFKASQAKKDFQKATDQAQKNKDTSGMDNMFDPGKKK